MIARRVLLGMFMGAAIQTEARPTRPATGFHVTGLLSHTDTDGVAQLGEAIRIIAYDPVLQGHLEDLMDTGAVCLSLTPGGCR